ncbi:MAG: hypothetical protein H6744_15665 [Deltaproteobacteria bacterium]|nr:hypothetical protein [Deltaproteobacteria bacterium]MCB9788119.1 hypothetical protein [Deltaproteobacteria bacterium]
MAPGAALLAGLVLGGLGAVACGGSTPAGDVDVSGGDAELDSALDAPDTELGPGDGETGPGDEGGGDADLDAPDQSTDAADGASDDGAGPSDADASACPEGAPCPATISGPCQMGRCNALGQCVTVPVPGCCDFDADCASVTPPSACDVIRCVGGLCVPEAVPGCCSSSDQCDDGLACTLDQCSGPGGRCVHCAVECPCEGPVELYSAHFSEAEPQAAGFFVEDLDPNDHVSWRSSSRRYVSPPTSLRLGDATCPTYYNGALDPDCQPVDAAGADSSPVELTLYSPAIPLPPAPGGHAGLVWLWSEVEPLTTGGPGERDVLRVAVDPGLGQFWPVTSSLAVGKSTGGEWRLLAFDMTPWSGNTVRLRFIFDTLDSADNHHEGVYLDDLSVVSRCEGGCCFSDSDCAGLPGADGCRVPRCVPLADGAGNVCALLPPDPGKPCTACDPEDACDDGNPCTSDSCDAALACRHDAFCCFEQVVLSASFEEGLSGWFVDDDQPADPVSWRTTTALAVVGGTSAWFGDPATGTYATGGRVRGSLTSSSVILPEAPTTGGELGVSFWLRLGTEWDGQLYDNPAGLDRLSLEIIGAGHITEVWSSDEVGGSTEGLWVPVSVPLLEYAGRPVQLRFTFDSVDDTSNDHEGAFIDGLELGGRCPSPAR